MPIRTGMNITAKVKTGKCRDIKYLFSLVQRAVSESLRERFLVVYKGLFMWLFNFSRIFILASIFINVGCSSYTPVQKGDVFANMDISINSASDLIFLQWHDDSSVKQSHGRLLGIRAGKVEYLQDVELPESVYSSSFGFNSKELLISSQHGGNHYLSKINIQTRQREVVYESKTAIRFPAELHLGEYYFLETNNDLKYSNWQKLSGNKKEKINNFPFRAAAYLNLIDDGLILFTPSGNFMTIAGRPFPLPKKVLDSRPFWVECSKSSAVTCMKDIAENVGGLYFSRLELISDQRSCIVPGLWRDVRSMRVSKSGDFAIFHARKNNESNERGIYFVEFGIDKCIVNEIPMREQPNELS